MLQLNHYETMQKFHKNKPEQLDLYFILSWVEFADNIWHVLRISEWLWLKKILLHNCKVTSKSLQVARNSHIEIVEISDLIQYILTTQDSIYSVEITNQSVSYKDRNSQSKNPIWLILWSEKHWVDEWILNITKHIHVPMYWTVSSLNVSHAGAVVAYEIAHQMINN